MAVAAGCSPGNPDSHTPLNSPYAAGAERQNVMYTAFTQRSPKYLDPASSYSVDETPYTYQIYEPLYGYHYLKRPYQLVPRSATRVVEPVYLDEAGKVLPADVPGEQVAQSVYDIPIKPGIMFQPHPAFAVDEAGRDLYRHLKPEDLEGKYAIPDFPRTGTRELTAEDYVYGIRRLATTRVVSPIYAHMTDYIVGFKEYGDRIRAADAELRKGLDPTTRDLPWLDFRKYAFEGVEALDKHTLRIRIKGKYPQFKYWLAMTFFSPIPWEADQFYSQPGMAARNLTLNYWPVGTGPYMLTEYRENRRHVLTRNPNFHGEPYPCEGSDEDRAAGLLADCGKPTPFIDRIVFNIEKESVPLQGKFLQGYYDVPQAERGEYGVAYLVAAGDSKEKAALYAERGLKLPTTVETQNWYMGFNWLDPVVGKGDTPEQQERNRKLRQAISIAVDWEEYVTIFENSQAQVAHGPLPPGLLGYRDPPAGANPVVYDIQGDKVTRKPLEAAKRLLAEAGYPDGRNAQTGQPLVLNYDAMGGVSPSARSQFDWLQRQFGKLGIQLEIRSTDYNRFQDKMRRGVAQIFLWGWNADYPDAENFLFLLYGPNGKAKEGGENASNYVNPEFDKLFERMKYLDDGPEKEAVIARMVAIVQNDAAWMFGYFPKSGGAYHQWVGNGKPTQMIRNNLQYLKIDPALRASKIAEWNRPVWWPVALAAALLVLLALPAWRMVRRRDRAVAVHADRPARDAA
ncbi:peptide ABC transporter substrate-binding protein [Pigmentiphaga sp. NML080357]|uniref:ABC transporter substrate-binding protein n=1 Tax=Pigmentiphaga sp. NML080357 TaxID=2008675 RepID=UPI000B419A50|nr:ABC transporter substrate-binding protein [Pigmentiphaga sp. NML080357]OVZ62989.1 peptide ABC transporter substrate-binding protein [Pigmentiphaga sp. NML080357]